MKQYDFLIVGAGLFGAVFAREASARGKRCLVVERRDHVGGNCYTKQVEGINVHWYGAHIFHTSDEEVWNYMNRFCCFNNYINSPIANYNGELYNLPFNMNTFCKLWPDVITPDDAKARISEQQAEFSSLSEPRNLYEQGMKLVGRDIFLKLVKGYSEKQWGMPAEEIPAFVLRRLPLRFTFNNNYFNDTYQGIPVGGYTGLFERILDGIDVRLNCDFLKEKENLMQLAERVVYTGPVDAFFDFRLGALDYRSLHFDHKVLHGVDNYQGNAVVNYTDAETPYTRIIEHKHFEFGTQPDTVVSYEYPMQWEPGAEPYYPVNNDQNNDLYKQYSAFAEKIDNVSFCGRLGEYKYYDMDKVVAKALYHPWLQV